MNGEITRFELDEQCFNDDFVCYESQMLKNWIVMGGVIQKGDRAGEPMPIKRVRLNTLCTMTTRDPGEKEKERYIFGVYLIGTSDPGDEWTWGSAEAHPKYRLVLSPTETKKMLFWNYHQNRTNSDNPKWGSGLHRYQSDIESAQILLIFQYSKAELQMKH